MYGDSIEGMWTNCPRCHSNPVPTPTWGKEIEVCTRCHEEIEKEKNEKTETKRKSSY